MCQNDIFYERADENALIAPYFWGAGKQWPVGDNTFKKSIFTATQKQKYKKKKGCCSLFKTGLQATVNCRVLSHQVPCLFSQKKKKKKYLVCFILF